MALEDLAGNKVRVNSLGQSAENNVEVDARTTAHDQSIEIVIKYYASRGPAFLGTPRNPDNK